MVQSKGARNPSFAEPSPGQTCDTIPLAQAKVVGQIMLYCNDIPNIRIDPTASELDKLWAACAGADCSVSVDAICDQLSEAIAAERWQSQLRILSALVFFYGQGEAGRRLANTVMAASSELVEHMAAEVPEVDDEASRLLTIWRLAQSLPPGEDIKMADGGGLSCFTDAAHAAGAACEEQPSDALKAATGTADFFDSTAVASMEQDEQTSNVQASSNDLLEFDEIPLSVDLLTMDTSCQPASENSVPASTALPCNRGSPEMRSTPANIHGLDGLSFPAAPSPQPASISLPCNLDLHEKKSTLTAVNSLDSISFPSGSSSTHFYIADVASIGNENRELDSMFDFGQLQDNPCRRQLKFAPLAADSIINKQLPRRKDPFNSLSGHLDLLKM